MAGDNGQPGNGQPGDVTPVSHVTSARDQTIRSGYTEHVNQYREAPHWFTEAEETAYKQITAFFTGAAAGERLNRPHPQMLVDGHPAVRQARDGNDPDVAEIRDAAEEATRCALDAYMKSQHEALATVVADAHNMSAEKLSVLIDQYSQPPTARMIAANPEIAVSQRGLQSMELTQADLARAAEHAQKVTTDWATSNPARARLQQFGLPAPRHIRQARRTLAQVTEQTRVNDHRLSEARKKHNALVAEARQQIGRDQLPAMTALAYLKRQREEKQAQQEQLDQQAQGQQAPVQNVSPSMSM